MVPVEIPMERHIIPVIPLAHIRKTEIFKGKYVVIKCCSTPTNSSLPTYDLPLYYFKTGTPEELFQWTFNVIKKNA